MKLSAPSDAEFGPARIARMKAATSGAATSVMDSSETAYYLRARLGPLRAWGDFLKDVRRGRAQLAGHELLPCCRIRGRFGWAPGFAVEDVQDFVANVLADVEGAGPSELAITSVKVNGRAGWRSPINSFNKDGSPYTTPGAAQ